LFWDTTRQKANVDFSKGSRRPEGTRHLYSTVPTPFFIEAGQLHSFFKVGHQCFIGGYLLPFFTYMIAHFLSQINRKIVRNKQLYFVLNADFERYDAKRLYKLALVCYNDIVAVQNCLACHAAAPKTGWIRHPVFLPLGRHVPRAKNSSPPLLFFVTAL
jgi:hypothetical protein